MITLCGFLPWIVGTFAVFIIGGFFADYFKW